MDPKDLVARREPGRRAARRDHGAGKVGAEALPEGRKVRQRPDEGEVHELDVGRVEGGGADADLKAIFIACQFLLCSLMMEIVGLRTSSWVGRSGVAAEGAGRKLSCRQLG